MSVPVFRDLDRGATSLLSQGFPVEKITVEIEGNPTPEFKFKTTGNQIANFNDHAFEFTTVLPKGVNLKYTVKSEKNTPIHLVESSFEDYVKGIKTTINGKFEHCDSSVKSAYTLSTLYRHRNIATSEFIANYATNPQITGNFSGIYGLFKFGVTGTLSLKEDNRPSGIRQAGAKVQFNPSNTLALTGFWDLNKVTQVQKVGTNFIYKYLNAPIEIAAQVVGNPADLKKPPTFEVGAQIFQNSSTFKTKLTSYGSIFASLKHQVSPNLSVIFGSEFSGLPSQSNSAKFGVSFNAKF